MVNRKHTKRFVQYAMDLVGLALAWLVVIEFRVALNPYVARQMTSQEAIASAPPLSGILLLWVAVGVWMMTQRPRRQRVTENFAGLFESVILASTLNVVVTFFSLLAGADFSRSFVLLSIPVNFFCLVFTRYIAALICQAIERRWPNPERVAIMGPGREASQIADQVRNSGKLVSVAGLILPHPAPTSGPGDLTPILGTTRSLAQVINRTRLDRIIVVHGWSSQREIDECGVVSKRMGVVLSRALAIPDANVKLDFAERFGLPLLNLQPVSFNRRQEVIKRGFDIGASALLLVALLPALVAIAVVTRLTSRGPVLYRSPRVGRGGRYFTFLKFRSMRVHLPGERIALEAAGKSGHLFKIRKDPRVTRFGAFLRKFSLDELPQLINVLRGDMSLVGPRPLPADDLDPDGQSREFAAWSERRSRVLPGITGLWQIRGRSDVPFEKMMELDVEYIRDWSLALDLRILLETPLVVLTGRGAY